MSAKTTKPLTKMVTARMSPSKRLEQVFYPPISSLPSATLMLLLD